LEGGHLLAEVLFVSQPSLEAGPLEDANLDLGHVEPTRVLRCVVVIDPKCGSDNFLVMLIDWCIWLRSSK
jgi:hypothetical protein